MRPCLILILIFIVVNSTVMIRLSAFPTSSAAAQVSNSGIGDNPRVLGQSSDGSSLSALFDPSNIKIISSNNTGYEAITPLDNGLVWHISMNSVPHVQYTPTDQDIERISATGEPLYNVHLERTITNDTISIETSFFVPYNALTRPTTLSNAKISHGSGSEESQSGEANSGNEGPIMTRGNIEGVIGTVHEYAEAVKSPISESAAAKYWEWYDTYLSNFLDLADFGNEVYSTIKEIEEAKDCVQNSPVQFASEEAKKMWENAMHAEEEDITAYFMLKGLVTILAKFPIGEVLGKPAEVAITKYGDSVFKYAIDYGLANIKKLSPCGKPVSEQQKEEFWNCVQLMKKNLKTFAINSCLNQEGTTPPLKQFTK